MTKMKMFVWHDVLCDHTCGIAVAMAENIEEARSLLIKEESALYGHIIDRKPDRIFDKPAGVCVWGG